MSDIYVDDLGEGFPFVFVHGYLGSSEMWCFQKNYFSKNYRVIAPALPGFGESYKAKSLNSINFPFLSLSKVFLELILSKIFISVKVPSKLLFEFELKTKQK